MKPKIKISVAVITYNQQETIRQTLDSILMQKGDFDLELVIGEDCSTDNTRAICEEYEKAYSQPLPKGKGIDCSFANVWGAHTADSTQYNLLKENASANRKNPTEAESVLWDMLKGNNIGLHFRRQHIILDYIVDFICLEKGLVIELDGGYHNDSEQAEYDKQRTAHLKQLGYIELRFKNEELLTNTDAVIAQIKSVASSLPSFQGRVGVRLLPSQKNLGIMANFARVMQACTGDYVAICAGDDYWCDEYKLQKQLNYFRTHPEVGVVSTSGYKLLVKSNILVPHAIAPFNPIADGDIKPFYFSPDYKGGVYAMPLSLLIKRDLLQYVDFDEFIHRGFPVEDYPMQAILAQHCKWGHINDLCVVYRVYKESATFISFDHPKYLQYYRGLAEIRRYLNELFPDDACFTEAQIQEQLFYKEFLLYLHRGEYRNAKELVRNASSLPSLQGEELCSIEGSVDVHRTTKGGRLKQAKRFTKSWLHFIAARFIKEHKYKQDLKKRV